MVYRKDTVSGMPEILPRAAFPTGFKGFAKVGFIDSRGATPDPRGRKAPLGPVLQTARIPIVITP